MWLQFQVGRDVRAGRLFRVLATRMLLRLHRWQRPMCRRHRREMHPTWSLRGFGRAHVRRHRNSSRLGHSMLFWQGRRRPLLDRHESIRSTLSSRSCVPQRQLRPEVERLRELRFLLGPEAGHQSLQLLKLKRRGNRAEQRRFRVTFVRLTTYDRQVNRDSNSQEA